MDDSVTVLRDPVDHRQSALTEALELKNYEFNAQGVELNQRDESSAVIPDEGAVPEHFEQDRQLHLQATTRPGAKLPHAWLVDESGRRVSTLDVTGKGLFTLITGLSGRAWVDAARDLSQPCLRTVVVGEKQAQDPYRAWARIAEVDEAGAILVRPDGYVAWRSVEGSLGPRRGEEAVTEAIDLVLDRAQGCGRSLGACVPGAAVSLTTHVTSALRLRHITVLCSHHAPDPE